MIGKAFFLAIAWSLLIGVLAKAEEDLEFKKGCRECHNEVIEKWDNSEVQHFPYRKQKCQSCHAAEHKKFTAEKEKPCVICHDLSSEKIKNAHFSADITGVDCLMCHTTHGTDGHGLLKETLHKPFAERMCSACHRVNSQGKIELMSEAKNICLVCHSDKNVEEGETLHPALDVSTCTDCHTPHTSKHEKLLNEKVSALCFGCHEEGVAKKHPYDVVPSVKIKIDPADQGMLYEGELACVSCHDPHKSAVPYLLRDTLEGGKLCHHCHSN